MLHTKYVPCGFVVSGMKNFSCFPYISLDESLPGGLFPSSPDLDVLILMFPQK